MKKITALLLALVMVAGLAACGSSGGQQSQAPASQAPASQAPASQVPAESQAPAEPAVEPVTLRIGYMANYASLWGVLSTINQGFFADESITVELFPFADGPSEIAAMEGGSIDLAYIGYGAHKLCIQGRATIFAPSSVHDTDRIVVTAESGIKTVADLKGKNVAFNSGSSSEAALNNALTVAGLTRDDIKLFDMDVAYMPSAVASGQVDAAVAWNPYSSEILKQVSGTFEIEFATDSVNTSSWICLPDYEASNHDVLVRFTRALLKGMDWGAAPENMETVAQLCADETKTSLESNLAQLGDAHWFNIADIKAYMSDGTLKGLYESVQDQMVRTETITADQVRDVDEWVLFGIIEEAMK